MDRSFHSFFFFPFLGLAFGCCGSSMLNMHHFKPGAIRWNQLVKRCQFRCGTAPGAKARRCTTGCGLARRCKGTHRACECVLYYKDHGWGCLGFHLGAFSHTLPSLVPRVVGALRPMLQHHAARPGYRPNNHSWVRAKHQRLGGHPGGHWALLVVSSVSSLSALGNAMSPSRTWVVGCDLGCASFH